MIRGHLACAARSTRTGFESPPSVRRLAHVRALDVGVRWMFRSCRRKGDVVISCRCRMAATAQQRRRRPLAQGGTASRTPISGGTSCLSVGFPGLLGYDAGMAARPAGCGTPFPMANPAPRDRAYVEGPDVMRSPYGVPRRRFFPGLVPRRSRAMPFAASTTTPSPAVGSSSTAMRAGDGVPHGVRHALLSVDLPERREAGMTSSQEGTEAFARRVSAPQRFGDEVRHLVV